MKLLLAQGLRHHRQKPLQTLLTLLGIAAGVALLCAMRLSQKTASIAFDRAVEAVAGAATHTVTCGPEGMPAASYAELRRRLGGRGVAPTMQAIARVPDRAERTVLRVLGVDPFGDVELRPWSGPRAGDLPVGRLVTEPDTFLATRALLTRLGLAAGDELAITVGGRPLRARCLGAISPPDNVAAGLADTLVVDVATAQEWTARLDRVDRFDLQLLPERLPAGVDVAADEAIVREVCGPGVRIARAGAGQRGLAQLTRGFRINVTALSLLSLLVGAFLVHETMRLSVVARRRSFGVLRALGAPGRKLGVVVALEALTLGLVGSLVGAALGVAAAGFLLEPIVRTLNDHYATFALPTLEVDPLELGLAAGGGVLVTVLAALGPAWTASRVAPREVMLSAGCGEGAPGLAWRWWWALAPAGLAALLLTTVGTRLVQGYLGMLSLLIAAVLLMPTLMTGALWLLSAPLRRLGPFARYVARSTAAARSHLALPVAAMVLAVATTIGMAVLVSSFRGSVSGWLGQVLPADVYVSVPGGVDERSQPVAPALVAALREVPDVTACTDYHRTVLPLRVAGAAAARDVEVVGMDPSPTWLASWPILAGDRA
ncbi:MAG: FtsX-like permease family protein, partial [Planctomycetota bacterium]